MPTLLLWLRAEWDRILGALLIAAGGVSLVATYQAVANDRFVAEQLADIASGGLGGLFLVAVGVLLRLEADLHDEWRKLDRIEAALRGDPLPDAEELLAGVRNGQVPRPARLAPQPALATGAGEDGPGDPVAPRGRGRRSPSRPAGALMVVAAAVVAAGYHRTAGSGDVADAVGGVAVAVAGLVLAGVVVAASQLVGRSRLAARKVRLLGSFLRPEPAPVAAAGSAGGFVLVAPGLTRFHHDGCPTLSRTETTRLRRAQVNGDLRGCQICGAS